MAKFLCVLAVVFGLAAVAVEARGKVSIVAVSPDLPPPDCFPGCPK